MELRRTFGSTDAVRLPERQSRRWLITGAFLVLAATFAVSDGHAQALVDEGFDNQTFRDPATTADWNTDPAITALLLPAAVNNPANPVNSLTGTFDGSSLSSFVDVSDVDATRAVAVGDIDGDGALDIVFGNNAARNSIYFNDGFGTFTRGANIPDDYFTGNTRSATVADFNGDGHLDVAFAEWGSSQASRVYFNNGSGANPVFSAGDFADLGAATLKGDSITAGDVDNDGDLDIVLGVDPGYVKLFRNDGFGNFDAPVDIADTAPANTFHARTVLLGDMDGDGDLDLVAARELATTRIYLNNGSGVFDTGQSAAPGVNNVLPAPDSVSIGDVDGDGLLDIVVGNDGSGTVLPGNSAANYLLINSGNPASLFPSVTFSFADFSVSDSAHLLDVDKDGDLDLVTADFVSGNGQSTPGTNRLYLNDPVANTPNIFPANGTSITGDLTVTKSIASGDFDGDRDLDLVFANQASLTSTGQNRYVANSGTDSGVPADQLFATGLSTTFTGVSLGSGVFLDPALDPNSVADRRVMQYWLSDDGGATWVTVHPERSVAFPAPVGNDLRWRVELNSLSLGTNPGLGRLVLRTNTAPSFTSAAVETATQDVPYQYDITATDQHDTILEIRANGVLPAWLTLTDNGNGTATLAGTPTNADIGGSPQNDVTLEVLDGARLMATQSFTIDVGDVNDPPTVVAPTGDQVYNQGDTVSLDTSLAFDDPDGDVLTYSATGMPASLMIDMITGVISGTLTNADALASPYTVNVTADDSNGGTVIDSFMLTVNNVNDAPIFISMAPTTATADIAYSYSVLTDDPDLDPVTITAPALPAWLTLTDNGDGTASLTGTPALSDLGDHAVSLEVDDGLLSTSQDFTITVDNVNDAPSFTSTPVTAATQDAAYGYAITTDDPDADPVTITAPTLPAWLTLVDNGDGTGTLSGTPGQADVGDHAVELVVDDGGLTDTQNFTITVADVNDAPAFTSTPVTSVTAGNAYSYSVEVVDPEGDALTITAAMLPTWLTLTDNGDGTADLAGTPAAANVGSVDITLTANDGTEMVDQAFTITVAAAPTPPPPRPTGGGGGGATSIPALLLLAGLAAGFRRRRRFDD